MKSATDKTDKKGVKTAKTSKEAKTKPKNHKRSLTELRSLFKEAVKAKDEKKAWILAKAYNKRYYGL